jgi:16S rRNA (cytosine1402-N4)-methyltransferase
MEDSELQMTMDETQDFTAAFLINNFSEDRIRKILYEYGEERFSDRISRGIVRRRAEKPIETTLELVDVIESSLRGVRYEGGHKAKRSFQAIRCYINQEMENIEPAINSVVGMLESGGRLTVISFHSGEDRIIKNCFRKHERPCECPSALPCVCGKKATVKIVTKKPVYPGERERKENPRSDSARLRVLEKM